MIIEISSSGGFGGIPAAAMHKRIDVDQQAPSLRQEICEAFEPRDLRQLAARSGNSRGADLMVYRITVTDRQDGPHVYDIREDQLPAEILDLIDQMQSAMIGRRPCRFRSWSQDHATRAPSTHVSRKIAAP